MPVDSAFEQAGEAVPSPAAQLRVVLSARELRSQLYPVVDLDSGAVAGFEAFARAPLPGDAGMPVGLFTVARQSGQLDVLDAASHRAAFHAAAGLGPEATTMFVNADHQTLLTREVGEWMEVVGRRTDAGTVVVDISDESLVRDPVQILAAAERIRAAGWRVALDDVGAHDLSIALLPLLQPDVVKLDLRRLRRRPPRSVAAVVTAVSAHAERTRCVIVAEGIDSAEDVTQARTLGAALGQGAWFTSERGSVVTPAADRAAVEFPPLLPPVQGSTPFESLPPSIRLRTSTKPLLVEVSRQLEVRAAELGLMCTVAATFQRAAHFTPGMARRFRTLADRVGLVAVLGESPADDPIERQWALTVLGPHFAAAVLAREITREPLPDAERRFEFAITYDRAAVETASRSLVRRIRTVAPAGGSSTSETADPVRGAAAGTTWYGMNRTSHFDPQRRLLSHLSVHDPTPLDRRETPEPSGHATSDVAHLRLLADQDPLTGLLNRRSLDRVWHDRLAEARRSDSGLAVLYLDLDGLKQINDTRGHAAGDAVIVASAARLQHRVRVDDHAARVGGDEFVVILSGLDRPGAAELGRRVADHLVRDLAEVVTTDQGTVEVSVSIGVATFPHDGSSLAELTATADRRMYREKLRHRQRPPGIAGVSVSAASTAGRTDATSDEGDR